MIKTIIFDFNGTLLDDLQINFNIFNLLAKDFNAPKITIEKYREEFDFPVKDVYRKLGFDVDDGKFVIIAERFHEYYNSLVYDNCKIFDSAIKILKELKGKYKLVCLSATNKKTLDEQLKHYNIYDYFDSVVGESNKYANGKVELGKSWIKESKIKTDEAIFIGDTVHDYAVSIAMNVKPILITTGHNSRAKLERTNAIVIDDLEEIKAYLD